MNASTLSARSNMLPSWPCKDKFKVLTLSNMSNKYDWEAGHKELSKCLASSDLRSMKINFTSFSVHKGAVILTLWKASVPQCERGAAHVQSPFLDRGLQRSTNSFAMLKCNLLSETLSEGQTLRVSASFFCGSPTMDHAMSPSSQQNS